jgi:hypothetical protein
MSSDSAYNRYLHFAESRRNALRQLPSGSVAESFLPQLLTIDEFDRRWNALPAECQSELDCNWNTGFEVLARQLTTNLMQLLSSQQKSAA